MPRELVPTVNVANLKSVWTIYQDIESRHSRGTLMDLREIVHESGLMKSRGPTTSISDLES